MSEKKLRTDAANGLNRLNNAISIVQAKPKLRSGAPEMEELENAVNDCEDALDNIMKNAPGIHNDITANTLWNLAFQMAEKIYYVRDNGLVSSSRPYEDTHYAYHYRYTGLRDRQPKEYFITVGRTAKNHHKRTELALNAKTDGEKTDALLEWFHYMRSNFHKESEKVGNEIYMLNPQDTRQSEQRDAAYKQMCQKFRKLREESGYVFKLADNYSEKFGAPSQWGFYNLQYWIFSDLHYVLTAPGNFPIFSFTKDYEFYIDGYSTAPELIKEYESKKSATKDAMIRMLDQNDPIAKIYFEKSAQVTH